MIGTFQYLAGQLDMAKEAWPTKGYPSPGLLAATRRAASSPADAGRAARGHRHRQPRADHPRAEEVGGDGRRPRQLHPQRPRADPAGAGAREPARLRPRRHARLQEVGTAACPVPAPSTSPPSLGDVPERLSSLDAPTWEMENAQFLQINWEVDDAAALDAHAAVAAPVDPAVRLVLRRALPGVARSGRSRSCRCAWWCGPASGRAPCASARCATRPPPSRPCASTGATRCSSARSMASSRHDQVRFTASLDGRDGRRLRRAHRRRHQRQRPDDVRQPAPGAPRRRRRGQARADRPGVHDPPGRPRPARGAPPRSAGPRDARGRCSWRRPIIGFTFRADTDLVPARFMIDAVESALTSTKRIR